MIDSDHYIGTKIGNYVLKRHLSGSGGSATVFLGENNNSRVWPLAAIKLPRTQLDSEEEQERFLREASVLRQLKHDHILSIIDAGFLPNTTQPYLIIEYAPNGSLKDRLERASQPITLAEAVSILFQIGLALQYAHAHEPSIVHCDVKPDNILFNSENRALLADFGIADVLDAAKTKAGAFIKGSLAYMAPEQFEGKASTKSDQYALSCVAYELFTGQKPFQGASEIEYMYKHIHVQPTSPTQLNPGLPVYMAQAVLKGLAKNHNDRFESIDAFIAALSVSFSDRTIRQAPEAEIPLSSATVPLASFTPRNTDPISGEATEHWLHEGRALLQAQHYEKSLQAFETAIRLDPKSARAYYGRGRALAILNRRTEAIGAYQSALHLDPEYADAFIGLGDIRFSFSRFDEALQYYQQAIRIDPASAYAYYGIGNACAEFGRNEEALDAYDSALRCNPHLLDAYTRRAKALHSLNRPDEAITTYEQLFKLAPDTIDYEHIVLLQPRTAEACYKKAALLEKLGRDEEAIATYHQILALDRGALDAGYKKAALLEKLGRDEEAIAVYERMIQFNPGASAAYMRKVALLEGLKRYDKVVTAYNQIIQRAPHYDVAHYRKGYALERLEEKNKSHPALLLFLEKVLPIQLQPFISRLISRPMYCQALTAYEQAIQHSPGNATYYASVKSLLQRLGKVDLATRVDDAMQKRKLRQVRNSWEHWPIVLACLNVFFVSSP